MFSYVNAIVLLVDLGIPAGVAAIARRIILRHVLCDKGIGGGYDLRQEDTFVANIATE